MTDTATKRTAKASVYIGDDNACWLVSETPSEVAALVHDNPEGLIELTLGNHSEWNGKPLYLRASYVTCISPPRNEEDDDDG